MTIQNEKLSKETLLVYVSQEQIFKKYLGVDVDVSRKFRNPFREDKNPDCNFYYGSNGTLYFTDFACRDCGGDCFAVCQLYYNCDFVTALRHINRDFRLGLYDGHIWDESIVKMDRVPLEKQVIEVIEKRRADIRYSWMPFTQYDLDYWKQFNVDETILNLFETKAGFKIWINGWLYSQYKFTDPIYVYPFDNGLTQIYRPLAKKNYKWRTNTDRSCVHGYKQLPQIGENLFITSSKKDVKSLYSIGITAISPPSEGTIPDELLLEELKQRFTNIYLFLDNDEPGRKYSSKLAGLVNAKKELFTPIGKDPAEMINLTSPKDLKQFIDESTRI